MPGMINNQWDRDSLVYFMSLTPEQFIDWYNRSSEDEIKYAEELFVALKLELDEEMVQADIENKLSMLTEYTLAKEIIEKVKK